MKKITILLLLIGASLSAQQKSTGLRTFVTGLSATLTLDSGNSTATIILTGPADRWFAFKFGSFTTGMQAVPDILYFNGTTLIDAIQSGSGPVADGTQNWSIGAGVVSGSSITFTATRPFISSDANDYTFVYTDTTLDLAGAHGQTAGDYTLAYHGSFRSKFIDAPITTALDVEDFSLNATQVYPNPSNGDFTVKTKTGLDTINVYSQVGTFVKTISVNNVDAAEVNLSGLLTGVYLLELLNATDKSWKKIIIN